MTAILTLGALVATIWGGVVLRRGGLLAGCLLVLLAGSCFGHAFYHLKAGPLPLTSERVLLAVLLAGTLGLELARRRRGVEWTASDGWLAALLVALTASTFSHDWRAGQMQPAANLLFYYFLPAGLYWLATRATVNERRLRWMLACLAGFALYLAATAIAETQAWSALVFPRYIMSLRFAEFYGRARGPFLNPVACGLYLTTGLFAALLLVPHWPRRRTADDIMTRPAGDRRRPLAGMLLAGGVLLILVGIYDTLTRSVWLGAFLGAVVLAALWLPRRWSIPMAVAGLVLGCALVVGFRHQLSAFKRDRDVSVAQMSDSARLRPILARVAWNMFRERPLLGFGLGQYPRQSVFFLGDRSTSLPLEKARPYVQHNVFLALLTETGLLGLGLYVGLLASWARAAWCLCRDARRSPYARQAGTLLLVVLVAYTINGMFHDLSIIPMVHMLIFFLAGITTALAHRRSAVAATGMLGSARSGQARRQPAPVLEPLAR